MHPPCKANPSEASSRLTYAARGERKVSALDKRKWRLSEVGWQTSSIKPPPPSQTGLHHLSQCCLGCLDQGLSYPVQLSYTVPPFKILERYWLEGRLRRPSSSDLGMHLLSNLGRYTLLITTYFINKNGFRCVRLFSLSALRFPSFFSVSFRSLSRFFLPRPLSPFFFFLTFYPSASLELPPFNLPLD